jgi:hypothetical protein
MQAKELQLKVLYASVVLFFLFLMLVLSLISYA